VLLYNLFEDKQHLTPLVIFPGGFHVWSPGHTHAYDKLKEKFSGADVFVAATNATAKRPFTFEQKRYLASQANVPEDRFVQVKRPYSANEITENYDPSKTILIFALSSKDAERLNHKKKDGSLGYLQPYPKNGGKLEPMNKHGYIYIVPKLTYSIGGKKTSSAGDIRTKYIKSSDADRKKLIKELYPKGDLKKIQQILDSVLVKSQVTESVSPHFAVEGSFVDKEGQKHALNSNQIRTDLPSGKIKDKNGQEYLVTHSVKQDERGALKHNFNVYAPGTPEEDARRGMNVIGKTETSWGKNRAMSVGVIPEFQRKGIATALYNYLEDTLGIKLRRNEAQTDDGDKFWTARERGRVNESYSIILLNSYKSFVEHF
jgi:GNAT superfamily N-acetyltransferase